MNTDLRKKAKYNFENHLFKLMTNAVFGKAQTYQTCHNRKKKKVFSIRTKLSYCKVFHRKFISNRNEKEEIFMNKPISLGLSILELLKNIIIS